VLADHPAGWKRRGVYSGVKRNGIIDESGDSFYQATIKNVLYKN
jgi:hypothetical protein